MTVSQTSKYDDVITAIGDFGPYQKATYFIFCLPAAIKAAIVMSSVFILSLPDYRCALPGYPNDTYAIQNSFHRRLINVTIPLTTRRDDESYSQCSVYDIDCSFYGTNVATVTNCSIDDIDTSKSTKKDCDEWVYESSEVSSSISIEYNLVCPRRAMRSHVNMGFFVGSVIGSLVFGFLADKLGRKVSLLLCVALQAVCGVVTYFMYSLYAIIVIRSIQGMTITMFAISASTGMELVGPSKRTFAGIVVEFFWSGGIYLVALVFYLADDWRLYQLVFGVISFLLLGALWYVPESPRWLVGQGKIDRAGKIFQKIAKSNKKPWSQELFATQLQQAADYDKDIGVARLLKNKAVMRRCVVVFFNWFAVNFLYYGLSFNLDNLSGSLYVNFLLSGTVELVSFATCLVALRYVGRRNAYASTMVVGAVACLVVIFPTIYGNKDQDWTIILLSMIGKMCASATYSILYIHTVELFPTIARNSVLGLASVFENCGGVVSPYVADLGILVGGNLKEALPLLVFGFVSLIAGLSSLALPETKDKPLPETIDDIIVDKKKMAEETSERGGNKII